MKLKRMKVEAIEDARQLGALFLDIMERGKRDRDSEIVSSAKHARELWEKMMFEQCSHDEKCVVNIQLMQESCDKWIEELLTILKSDGSPQETPQGTVSRSMIIR